MVIVLGPSSICFQDSSGGVHEATVRGLGLLLKEPGLRSLGLDGWVQGTCLRSTVWGGVCGVGPGVCVEQAVCLQWSEAMARKKFVGSIHVTTTQQVPCKPLVYAPKR